MASALQIDDPAQGTPLWASSRVALFLLTGLGLLVRLWWAGAVFVNPDEALHYLLSLQPDLQTTYQATLTTAHPPLYIVLLHYWGYLGNSELFLRLPSVLAGTGVCWMLYWWLKRITNQSTAVLGLTLSLFSPALILVSTELRQYALLLFFCASALYWLDRSLAENSRAMMFAFGLFLWLALLTHYSACLFALTIGIYALLRIRSSQVRAKTPASVAGLWLGTQVVALAITAALFKTHVSKLRSRGMPAAIADSYLKGSIFHRGEDHVASFIFKTTIRLFHYLFSQEAVGIAGLLLFGVAIYGLVRARIEFRHGPSSSQLAFLLIFPLLSNCLAALGGFYPYGGSRHNSYLAIFVVTGIAIALAHWSPRHSRIMPVTVAILLLVCNLFPAPTGQYIRPRDQNRKQMQAATNFLRQNVAPGAVILTDDQGGMLLSYYLCQSKVVQFNPPFQHLFEAPCGPFQVVSLDPHQWIFHAATFPAELRRVEQTFRLPPGQTLWLFQAGWLIDKEFDFRTELAQFGCPATQDFGRNILVCQITLPLEQSPQTTLQPEQRMLHR
jgi:4-amino-4-deoxy-L-arabinose transferase-like glycosyltransferase